MPTNFENKIRSASLDIIYELYHAQKARTTISRVVKYFAVYYYYLQFMQYTL